MLTATVLLGTAGMALTCAGATAALLTVGEGASSAVTEPTLEVASLARPASEPEEQAGESPPPAEEPRPPAEGASPTGEPTTESPAKPAAADPDPAPPQRTPTTTASRRAPVHTGTVTMYRHRPAAGSTRTARRDVSYADLLTEEEEAFPHLDTDPDVEAGGSAEERSSNDEMAEALDEILEDFDPAAIPK
ncbi:MAG: hypothetical protein JRI25_03770 [Deltaproteobacteria bacterium]|nr:hypothetical protein [Deltaproteobacteria bacterium]MBW2253696.1 hypothetical protein [Deltaproteobacteria bacterium]